MDVSVSVHWNAIEGSYRSRVTVVDRARLLNNPDACIPVGTAPDGLPLVLRVSRSASIIEPVLKALHASEIKELSADVRTQLLALDKRLQVERRELGVAKRGPLSDGPHYVSMSSVPSLFGDTLMARLLGSSSPLLLPEDRTWAARDDDRAARTSCGVLMSAEERVRVAHDLDRRQHLAIPLDDSAACVVRRHKDDAVVVGQGRPLVFEDLRALSSTTFYTYERVEGEDRVRRFTGSIGNGDEYRAALRRADGVGWTVTREDLLRSVVAVARSLAPLHKSGLVHGDIKPANVLITKDGAAFHDSLDVKIGAISAAGTKGWNAPEQIIARPVSPATDVFSLAQLVVQILEAAVFGDERAFVVPTGNGQRIRERMLVEPDVYLDPTLVPLKDADIAAWRAFLRKCLALEADRRFQSATQFADELLTILERHRVPGRRVVTGLAGRLTKNARLGDGISDKLVRLTRNEDDVVWLLDDSYSHVHRMPWAFIFGLAA